MDMDGSVLVEFSGKNSNSNEIRGLTRDTANECDQKQLEKSLKLEAVHENVEKKIVKKKKVLQKVN